MKLALPSLLLLSALSTAPSLVAADDWQCNGWWGDGGLRRYSFLFKGYCEDRWGQCFLDNIRHKGLIVHNWQAWKRSDGWWQVDLSTTADLGWQVNKGITDITKIYHWCWDNL